MNKALVIHQPNFLPRLKVFIKIAISDSWVIYDDVQYVRREWQNRVYLRDAEHRSILFTAPVKKADFHEKINKIQLENVLLLNEHLVKHFQCNYSKAPYYNWVEAYLDSVKQETRNVCDLSTYNVICTNIAFRLLDIKLEEIYSSQIYLTTTDRNGKLIELCRKNGSTYYICGSGGKTYINETVFRQAGVNIIYYDYSQISYIDSCSLDYYRNNSFLDFVAYNGPELLRKLIIAVKQQQIECFK